MSDKSLLTVDEVADFLRVAPNTVYRWCRDGKLTGIKIGKEWRITQTDLDQFLADRTGRATANSLETLLKRRLAPPEHILVMSSDPEAVYRLQAEFLQIGLEGGHPLFIGCWWQRPDQVRERLTAAGLPVAELEVAGRLTLADFNAAYTEAGPEGVIALWEQQAEASGGQVFWGTGSHRLSDWDGQPEALIRFEDGLHQAFQRLPVIALCPCMLDRVDQPGFETLLDLTAYHSSALFLPHGEPLLMKTA